MGVPQAVRRGVPEAVRRGLACPVLLTSSWGLLWVCVWGQMPTAQWGRAAGWGPGLGSELVVADGHGPSRQAFHETKVAGKGAEGGDCGHAPAVECPSTVQRRWLGVLLGTGPLVP